MYSLSYVIEQRKKALLKGRLDDFSRDFFYWSGWLDALNHLPNKYALYSPANREAYTMGWEDARGEMISAVHC